MTARERGEREGTLGWEGMTTDVSTVGLSEAHQKVDPNCGNEVSIEKGTTCETLKLSLSHKVTQQLVAERRKEEHVRHCTNSTCT